LLRCCLFRGVAVVDYGHRWYSSADGDCVECYWCMVSPLSPAANEPCDRFHEAAYYGVGPIPDKEVSDG
jgi:hypothetical protein